MHPQIKPVDAKGSHVHVVTDKRRIGKGPHDWYLRRYHDGYLSIHFEANKYQDIELTPLQEEALWCVPQSSCAWRWLQGLDFEWSCCQVWGGSFTPYQPA